MKKSNFSEEELRHALGTAMVDANKKLIFLTNDREKLMINKALLGFVADFLKRLDIEWQEERK